MARTLERLAAACCGPQVPVSTRVSQLSYRYFTESLFDSGRWARWSRGSAATTLARGANPNARTTYGDTPLHRAVLHMHVQSVRLLLDAGADPNSSDHHGETPLMNVESSSTQPSAL